MNMMIALFFSIVPIITFLLLLINLIFAPHAPYKEKDSPFECGFHSFIGQSRTQFNISFFVFGILFLIFDLEIVLTYPILPTIHNNEILGIFCVITFFLLLVLGFAFELGKKALTIFSRQNKLRFDLNSNNNTPEYLPRKYASLPIENKIVLPKFIFNLIYKNISSVKLLSIYFSNVSILSYIKGITLSENQNHSGPGVDLAKFALYLSGIYSLLGKLILITILNMRTIGIKDFLRKLIEIVSLSLVWNHNNPPKPHFYARLPLESKIFGSLGGKNSKEFESEYLSDNAEQEDDLEKPCSNTSESDSSLENKELLRELPFNISDSEQEPDMEQDQEKSLEEEDSVEVEESLEEEDSVEVEEWLEEGDSVEVEEWLEEEDLFEKLESVEEEKKLDQELEQYNDDSIDYTSGNIDFFYFNDFVICILNYLHMDIIIYTLFLCILIYILYSCYLGIKWCISQFITYIKKYVYNILQSIKSIANFIQKYVISKIEVLKLENLRKILEDIAKNYIENWIKNRMRSIINKNISLDVNNKKENISKYKITINLSYNKKTSKNFVKYPLKSINLKHLSSGKLVTKQLTKPVIKNIPYNYTSLDNLFKELKKVNKVGYYLNANLQNIERDYIVYPVETHSGYRVIPRGTFNIPGNQATISLVHNINNLRPLDLNRFGTSFSERDPLGFYIYYIHDIINSLLHFNFAWLDVLPDYPRILARLIDSLRAFLTVVGDGGGDTSSIRDVTELYNTFSEELEPIEFGRGSLERRWLSIWLRGRSEDIITAEQLEEFHTINWGGQTNDTVPLYMSLDEVPNIRDYVWNMIRPLYYALRYYQVPLNQENMDRSMFLTLDQNLMVNLTNVEIGDLVALVDRWTRIANANCDIYTLERKDEKKEQ